jgi:hypothetical protein
MKRNELTTVDKLRIGDRFHKAGDQKKKVWTKVENETKVTNYQTYKHWGLPDGEKWPQALKGNSPVVFLRHATESAVTSGAQ